MADDIVRTKGIEIVDDAGNVRAFFGLGADGEPGFHLFNLDGTPRLQLAITDSNQANLVIHDAQGKPRASVSVDSDGTAAIMLSETATKQAVILRLNADDTYEGSFDDPIGFHTPHPPHLTLLDPKPKGDEDELQ